MNTFTSHHIASSGIAMQAATYDADGKPVTVDLHTGDRNPSTEGEYFIGDGPEEFVAVHDGRWVPGTAADRAQARADGMLINDPE